MDRQPMRPQAVRGDVAIPIGSAATADARTGVATTDGVRTGDAITDGVRTRQPMLVQAMRL